MNLPAEFKINKDQFIKQFKNNINSISKKRSNYFFNLGLRERRKLFSMFKTKKM
jgi:hypothetical protein